MIPHELSNSELNEVNDTTRAKMRNLKLRGRPAFKEIRDGIIKALGEERAMLISHKPNK